MFSLRGLCFVLCSRDLDAPRAKDHRLFIFVTHKSTRSANPITWLSLDDTNSLSSCVGIKVVIVNIFSRSFCHGN